MRIVHEHPLKKYFRIMKRACCLLEDPSKKNHLRLKEKVFSRLVHIPGTQ